MANTPKGVPETPKQPEQNDRESVRAALSSGPQTVRATPPETVRQRIERLRLRLDQRRKQIEWYFNLFWNPVDLKDQPEAAKDILSKVKQYLTAFDEDEMNALARYSVRLQNEPDLLNAFIIGGETVEYRECTFRLYTMGMVGAGGIGGVKDAVMLIGGELLDVVVKVPIVHTSAHKGTTPKEAQKHQYYTLHMLEVLNAWHLLLDEPPIPGLIEPVFVSKTSKGEFQLPIIGYKKVLNEKGKTEELLDVFQNPTIVPSEKMELLAQLTQIVAALEKVGIVHFDLKPTNVLLNEKRKPVVIDIGSLITRNDTIVAKRGGKLKNMGAYKVHGSDQYGIPTTPHYYPLEDLEKLLRNKSLSLLDRRALGYMIQDFLIYSGLINLTEPDEWIFINSLFAKHSQKLRSKKSQYPTQSVHDIYTLSLELINIHSPQRPLSEIARYMETLVSRLRIEIDILYKQTFAHYSK